MFGTNVGRIDQISGGLRKHLILFRVGTIVVKCWTGLSVLEKDWRGSDWFVFCIRVLY